MCTDSTLYLLIFGVFLCFLFDVLAWHVGSPSPRLIAARWLCPISVCQAGSPRIIARLPPLITVTSLSTLALSISLSLAPRALATLYPHTDSLLSRSAALCHCCSSLALHSLLILGDIGSGDRFKHDLTRSPHTRAPCGLPARPIPHRLPPHSQLCPAPVNHHATWV